MAGPWSMEVRQILQQTVAPEQAEATSFAERINSRFAGLNAESLPIRRMALALAAEQMFEQDFAGRCHVFDSAAAKNHALIVAARTRQGQPISTEDAQIAAIALACGLTVATRNTRDFENIDGLILANPWKNTSIFE
ncbi:MAG: VapC toxin family PIN domain ribonuclease [Burkholderiales bacterium]|nr:VapC toxin family PIN domain ribonuclease [Burkholderiales bacterium]